MVARHVDAREVRSASHTSTGRAGRNWDARPTWRNEELERRIGASKPIILIHRDGRIGRQSIVIVNLAKDARGEVSREGRVRSAGTERLEIGNGQAVLLFQCPGLTHDMRDVKNGDVGKSRITVN